MSTAHYRRFLLVSALSVAVLGGATGCGRQEKDPPEKHLDPSTHQKDAVDKTRNVSTPGATPVTVPQENTIKDYLASADKAKAILAQVKEAGDVNEAVDKLKKERANVKSIIAKLESEVPPPQPLKHYAGQLTRALDDFREATRSLPQDLPADKRQILGEAAQMLAGLMIEFNTAAERLKVVALRP
jgi:hypothetical protein